MSNTRSTKPKKNHPYKSYVIDPEKPRPKWGEDEKEYSHRDVIFGDYPDEPV